MNKILLLIGVFCITASAVYAQWIENPTNTTVTSVTPIYSDELEYFYSPDPFQLPPLPHTYVRTVCSGGSCSSSTNQYDLLSPDSYPATCEQAAASAGILPGESYTCSRNYAYYGYTCVPQPGDPSTVCYIGYGDTIGGGSVWISGGFRALHTTEIYRGTRTPSAGCKAFPSDRWSGVNTREAILSGFTDWVDPPRFPAVRQTECATTVYPGSEPQIPVAVLSANPSTIVSGGSSALAYSCSNGATSAVINNGVGLLTPASAGTAAVTPSSTTTYTLTCTNAQGSATATATVTVTPPTVVDLTTSAITPTSATAGSAVSLSATASNIGTATSGSFPILFQIQSPAELKNSGYLAALAPSAGAPASVSHTFAAAGTYQVRACANFNTAWQAITTESDYANNCGPWTAITVAAAPAAPSLSCTVSTQTPAVGDSVTYTASGASAPFTWTSSEGISFGSAQTAVRTFTAQGQYGMTLAKSGFTSAECPIVTAGAAPCTNPTGTITATPNRIRPGATVGVSYTASGIQGSCTITGPTISQTIPASSCTVPSGSVTTGPLTTQSTFILTCDGTERARTVVNVVPQFEEF